MTGDFDYQCGGSGIIALAQRLVPELITDLASSPSTLYHYTNYEGLLGIVSKRELWLSNIEFLNDGLEYKFARARLREVLSARELGDEERCILEHFYRSIADAFSEQFAFCMCKQGDLLSQWRGYGGGVSIGFSTELFYRNSPFDQDVILQKVCYEELKQRKRMSTFIDECVKYGREENALGVPPTREWHESWLNIVRPFYDLLASMFKHPGFSEENEYRLLHFRNPRAPVDTLNNLNFKAKGTLILPYVIAKATDGGLNIKDIIIGPSKHQSLLHKAITTILLKYNYVGVDIECSDTPLRN